MAYFPISPSLSNGSVLTQDHIRHIEGGIAGAESYARGYADQLATQIQVGQVTDPAFDAAVDRAVADGRLVVEGGGAGGGGTTGNITITETQPGVYQFEV